MSRRKATREYVAHFDSAKKERPKDQFDSTLKNSKRKEPKQAKFVPRNDDQRDLLADLENPEKRIVFVTGPAGTGKTFATSIWAVEQLQSGKVEKIVLTRPAVSTDEQLGFLPGDLGEKMAPWIRPFFDALRTVFEMHEIDRMIRQDIIEIAPLAYMRGRSFANCILIGDEFQSTTVSQMKMVLTRIGENSKFVITGDLGQQETGFEENGLRYIIDKLDHSDSDLLTHVNMTVIERSAACEAVLRLIGE